MKRSHSSPLCPTCGKQRIRSLGDGFYRCRSCGTPFYIKPERPQPQGPISGARPRGPRFAHYNKIRIWLAILVIAYIVFLIFMPALTDLWSEFNSRNQESHPAETTTDPEPAEYAWYREEHAGFADAAGRWQYLIVGQLADTRHHDRKAPIRIGRFDAEDGTPTWVKTESNIPTDDDPLSVTLRSFRRLEDANFYLIDDGKRLYRIDADDGEVTFLNPLIQRGHERLVSGIAEIRFLKGSVTGFHIISNEGDAYDYLLQPDILTDRNKAPLVPKDASAAAEERIGFSFIKDPKGARQRLHRYTYRHYPGYMHNEDYLWRSFLHDELTASSLVTQHVEFTPDRHYFGARVLGNNDEAVLIAFKKSVAADAPWIIQLLDAQDGSIIISRQLKYSGSSLPVAHGGWLHEDQVIFQLHGWEQNDFVDEFWRLDLADETMTRLPPVRDLRFALPGQRASADDT